MLFVRSLIYLIVIVIFTLFFAPLSLLTFPFSFETRYRFIKLWAQFNLWWLEKTCRLRYRVKGLENIPDTNAIIFCKHQSVWETLALQRIFPPQVWLLKRELLWVPFFGWGLALLEPIAINRKSRREAMNQLLAQGMKRLADGRWVVIFPEGTRVAPGQKKSYQKGGAILAEKSAYPVVPVAHNAGEFWPRRGFIKYPGTIQVAIGPAIDTRGKSYQEINQQAESWIEGALAEFSASSQGNP